MRVVSVDNLEPGLIVGRPVVSDNGQVLLNRGVVLNETYIKALRDKGYSTIYVTDTEAQVDVEADDDLDPVTRSRAIGALRKTFEAIQHSVPDLRQRSFEDISKACSSDAMRALMCAGGPFDDMLEVAGDVLSKVLNRSTLAGLTSIKCSDSKLYHHSVDVCVVAIMIARAIGLSSAHLRQLAVGSLLHDIGMVFIDPTTNELTRVRQHTLLGYELLRNGPNPDLLVPHIALEHHERQDGSGEPRGLVGSNTIRRDRSLPPPVPTLLGEIAAVANVYDNLLTGTLSRPPMTPDAVVQTIRAAAGTHMNRMVVSAFVRLVPVYPLGTEVIVSSQTYHNYTGIVCSVNPKHLDKPVIMLFKDNQGRVISPIELDMAQEKGLRVRCKFGAAFLPVDCVYSACLPRYSATPSAVGFMPSSPLRQFAGPTSPVCPILRLLPG